MILEARNIEWHASHYGVPDMNITEDEEELQRIAAKLDRALHDEDMQLCATALADLLVHAIVVHAPDAESAIRNLVVLAIRMAPIIQERIMDKDAAQTEGTQH